MNTIWKYELKPQRVNKLMLPAGAQVLSAGLDPQGEVCVWALVRPDLPKTQAVRIYVYGTGHDVPLDNSDRVRFLGTVLMPGLGLVWHVFEGVEGPT